MADTVVCAEPDCTALVSDLPGSRCGGPDGPGCERLFCDEHLYPAGMHGYLCSVDYDDVPHGDLDDYDQEEDGRG